MGKPSAAIMMAGLLLAACGPSEAVLAQRARLDAEQTERLRALDDVEARLASARTRQALWQELEERHQNVSEIACENVADHVAQMERHEQRFQARVQAQRHRRVARLDTDEAITPTSAGMSD